MTKKTRLLALVAAVVMLFSMASCSTGDTTWAYKINDVTISSGLYLYYQWVAFSEAAELVQEELDATDGNETTIQVNQVLDYEVEGKPAAQWIEEETLQLCKRHAATVEEMQSHGLLLTQEELDNASATASSTFASYETMFSTLGVGTPSLEEQALNETRTQTLFDYYYTDDGPRAVSESEIQDYFSDNYALGIIFPVYTTGLTGDDLAEREAQIDALVDELNSGTDFIEAAKAFEDQFGEDEEDYKFIEDETVESDFEVRVPKDTSQSNLSEAVSEAIWNMAGYDNFTRINASSSIIYVVARRDIMSNALNLALYRSSVLAEMKSDEYFEIIDDVTEGLSVTANESALNKYTTKAAQKRIGSLY